MTYVMFCSATMLNFFQHLKDVPSAFWPNFLLISLEIHAFKVLFNFQCFGCLFELILFKVYWAFWVWLYIYFLSNLENFFLMGFSDIHFIFHSVLQCLFVCLNVFHWSLSCRVHFFFILFCVRFDHFNSLVFKITSSSS